MHYRNPCAWSRVPQQLSLVCYEDIPWLHTWSPPITVVDDGARQLADVAMDLVLGQLERPVSTPLDTVARTHHVSAALVERAGPRSRSTRSGRI
jgi:LacI family transcriptional regulator, galactose operon repressor